MSLTCEKTLNLSINICSILKKSAREFGYTKGNDVNISGFLNVLIPKLIKYNNESYFLKNKSVRLSTSLNNIKIGQHLLIDKLDNFDDATMKISFRVNKCNINEFTSLENELSEKNITFANYITMLITDFCQSETFIKEEMFYFDKYLDLCKKIKKNRKIRIYTKNDNITMILLDKEIVDNHLYIVGYNKEEKNSYKIRFTKITSIIDLGHSVKLNELELKNAVREAFMLKVED